MFKQTEYIKNCYYCLHGRPKRNDLCSIHRIYVKDIHNHTCSDFLLDDTMTRVIEEVKAEEEGDQQFFYLNFNSYICENLNS